MQKNFKRIISVIIALSICVTMFAVLPFTSSAATVTHDVTGDAASKLSFSANYDLSMQATHFGNEFLNSERVENNLFKNATFEIYRHDKQTLTPWNGTWNKTYDGVMDNAGTWAMNGTATSYVYSQYGFPDIKDEHLARGYLTITLDSVYILDELYILSGYKSFSALYDYDVYVGSSLDTLYNSNNLVSSFKYTGYGNQNASLTIGKLNFGPNGNSNNFAEGQIYTYTGNQKPTGKYIGIKLNETSNYTEKMAGGCIYVS